MWPQFDQSPLPGPSLPFGQPSPDWLFWEWQVETALRQIDLKAAVERQGNAHLVVELHRPGARTLRMAMTLQAQATPEHCRAVALGLLKLLLTRHPDRTGTVSLRLIPAQKGTVIPFNDVRPLSGRGHWYTQLLARIGLRA